MSAMGSVFGLAYGDSVGKDVEFMPYHKIVSLFGKSGPDRLAYRGQVTDDTQMALAVGEALVAVRGAMKRRARITNRPQHLRVAEVEQALVNRFINWLDDPENNRAPGTTCLTACRKLANGYPWWEAASGLAKGCGANMRVTPVALCDWLSHSERSAVAQFQAALTHFHPTALAAADATQYAVWLLNAGFQPDQLLDELDRYAANRNGRYHHEWLGDLWMWTGSDHSAAEYSTRGWNEVADILNRVRRALRVPDDGGDVCRRTGEGWTAEEALGGALLAFLRHPDEPLRAISRGAATNGDSDSIAALAGAFAGAHRSLSAFPISWSKRIEYADRLRAVAIGIAEL